MPDPVPTLGRVPFEEASRYFRDKVRLPTERWTDLWQGMHARGFVVAGAMKDELLADFQAAIQKAIDEGTTLAEFRKDFDRIVATHGWSYKGSRGWRSRVIYDTNLRMARAAGRWEQIQRVKAARPYLRYVAVEDSRTRPQHRAWHGTVLPVDHPWWKTHYPPNGWRCRCTVMQLSVRDLERWGYALSDAPPPGRKVGRWINTSSGRRLIRVPEGIDPGFAYNPGEAAFGSQLDEASMAAWRETGAEAWERLTPGGWTTAKRPATIPVDPTATKLMPRVEESSRLHARIAAALGGEAAVIAAPDGSHIALSATALATHLAKSPKRSRFIPLLREVIEDPFEIWLSFERHKGTGKVELRKRFIKIVEIGAKHPLLLVAQAAGGRFVGWTFFDADPEYLMRQRVGKMVWGRKDGGLQQGPTATGR